MRVRVRSYPRKILLMGLPGSGKTTLARHLSSMMNAVHFNGDEVRLTISKDLSFSLPHRIEQARRMGWLCDLVVKSGGLAIADFICPTEQTRSAFLADGPAYIVWLDRIKRSRFEDTNEIFEEPSRYDMRFREDGDPATWARMIAHILTEQIGFSPFATGTQRSDKLADLETPEPIMLTPPHDYQI